MDIQVGDRIAFKYLFDDNEIYTFIIRNTADLEDYEKMKENNRIEILKIERPKYEVVEEKKELLTEEEREFLRLYMKINDINASKIKINHFVINFKNNNCFFTSYINTDKSFHSLVLNREYTLKELGLE